MATNSTRDQSSLFVSFGDDQITISLKQLKPDHKESSFFASILIEMGDFEIEVRRSQKKTSRRSTSVTHRLNNHNRQTKAEEKCKIPPLPWDYSILHGPTMWCRMFPQLLDKKFQSPIRIYTDLCEYEPLLARHSFIFETDVNCCQTLENTGHSFQVSGQGYSYITRGPVLDEYQFLQFHMHWGENDSEGSEHVIDGGHLPAELHIVTWNRTQYRTPEEAMASEQFDGLLVFAVLIKIVSNDNSDCIKLFDLFSKITHRGEKINLDYGIISLRDLMPEHVQKYYTYDGSLTTPMCNECVRWVVFRDTIGLSKHQLNQLRQLKQTCKTEKNKNEFITRNFRPVMPLNGRTIYRSFA
ncbi:unnamed protein product [Rotaria magnacalcarata]|uniref:carbonic anhydrase n=2 Tax=Rotaria magnacalcarata TaxID=392030 RepID=A0A816CX60_9BILA|nr:unnamed protein product [Rotaria magnacalcarata]CAF3882621.1 unnamed protein product [Rotaria magnacalcarata]